MSTRIKRDFDFLSGVYFNQKILMNAYAITLYLDILTESMVDQQIAIERIKYFVDECLNDCVFINQKEKKIIDKLLDLNLKVCTLPEDPYDQIITIALLTKFNAIVENRFECGAINLKSILSDGVEFLFDVEENLGPFEEKNHWWSDHSMSINDLGLQNKKDKVVKINKQASADWTSVNLNWQNKIIGEKNASEVIFFMDTDK